MQSMRVMHGARLRTRRLLRTCIAASIAAAACSPSSPPPAPHSTELTVLLRSGPATWFVGPDDRGAGIDFDLAQLFARQEGATLKVVPTADPLEKLGEDGSRLRIGAGNLYHPDSTPRSSLQGGLLYSSGYYAVEPVLIYNTDGFKPESWQDLAGESVGVLDGGGLVTALVKVRADHPEVRWEMITLPSTEAMISQVSDGTLGYAIVASNDAEAARHIYLNFEKAFAVAGKQELVWAFPPAERRLRDRVNAFFATLRHDGRLRRLIERYFSYGSVPRIDAGVFQERIKSLLPQLRSAFQRAQEATGIEWRLLAAIAYQESQWDAQATSETGVRGLMQLTDETAQRLGGVDRLDPKASVLAAARYLRDLKSRLPQRIPEPDLTWLALAAYNIGIAHLEDARILAQKQKLDPDTWSALKKTLPLLALPEYYESAKYGYARGAMPVTFVDRVRAYYDILLAQQPPLQPRLRMLSGIADENAATPMAKALSAAK
ncbi:MAG: membrane-bound lytic murein transglycosylase MltF [Casimicrobiaceae bacterium]